MYIYYNNKIINTNLTFDIKKSLNRVLFTGPAQYRSEEIIFEDEKTAIQVIKGIYSGLDSGWGCLDIQKDIFDKGRYEEG